MGRQVQKRVVETRSERRGSFRPQWNLPIIPIALGCHPLRQVLAGGWLVLYFQRIIRVVGSRVGCLGANCGSRETRWEAVRATKGGEVVMPSAWGRTGEV